MSADDAFIHTVLNHSTYQRCFRTIRSTNWLTSLLLNIAKIARMPQPARTMSIESVKSTANYRKRIYSMRFVTILFTHGCILAVRERTRRPVAKAGQVEFVPAEFLSFRSATHV